MGLLVSRTGWLISELSYVYYRINTTKYIIFKRQLVSPNSPTHLLDSARPASFPGGMMAIWYAEKNTGLD